jgi:hypothetical protein
MISNMKIMDFILLCLSWKDTDFELKTSMWNWHIWAAVNLPNFEGLNVYYLNIGYSDFNILHQLIFINIKTTYFITA